MKLKAILCLTTLYILFSSAAQAAVWKITYPRALDEQDRRHEYPLALLKLALDKTGVRYVMNPSDRIMLQGKSIRQLRENREINIIWAMTDSQREKELLPIRVPIAKGLIGWRVFMIQPQTQDKFSRITQPQGLTSLIPVQGEDWPDTKILQANGFNVLVAKEYTEALNSLLVGQADFFPRSVIEVIDELESSQRSQRVALEKQLILHYTSAMYYFVNRADPTMARLIEIGLRRAIADGSFELLFMAHFAKDLDYLHIDKRRVLSLDNPILPPETPLDIKEYWYDPKIHKTSLQQNEVNDVGNEDQKSVQE
jgi:hypothetical protein